MERLSDKAIEIINELHIERLDYNSEYLPLINAVQKLQEYEDAEEKGVLPLCKVGDTVYETDGIKIYENKIKKIIYDTGSIAFDETAIGENVFLKREQAIKKLEGEKI